jgi:hypothetical protein
VAGLVCLSVVGLQAASTAPLAPNAKVRICHASSSQSNPYVSEEPTVGNNGDLNGGHLNHNGPVFPKPDWGDIIPPYTYLDANGVEQIFPGYNWTPEGQAIWEYGCTPGRSPLTPLVECVEPNSSGGFLAHFGYDNPNSSAVVQPFENSFSPEPADRGQPTVFKPGRAKDVFQAESTDGSSLTWSLTGNQAKASSDSKQCAGSITIVKVLHPSDDSGRFALKIDGTIRGDASAVGDGGTTGTIAVSAGQHSVGESAASGTDLANYYTQIVCRKGDTVVATATAASVPVPVAKTRTWSARSRTRSRARPSQWCRCSSASSSVTVPRIRLCGATATTTTSPCSCRSARATASPRDHRIEASPRLSSPEPGPAPSRRP